MDIRGAGHSHQQREQFLRQQFDGLSGFVGERMLLAESLDLSKQGIQVVVAAGDLALEAANLVDEFPGQFLLRGLENSFGRPFLIDKPLIHVEDPRRDVAGELHFMRDNRHGHAFAGQTTNDGQHFTDHGRIQSRGRLVEQHDLGFHGQTPGNRHPLFLSARKFMRKRIPFFCQSHQLEQIHGGGLGSGCRFSHQP